MSITSFFYEGGITDATWAMAIPNLAASTYGVKGAGDFKINAVSGADRTVQATAGEAWGQGIYDVSDVPLTLQLDAVSSGSRWDLVVLRRDWSTNTTALAKVNGSTVKAIPADRLASPGDTDDQPLALVCVTAGQSQPTAIVDLRCWGSSGGVAIKDDLAKGYLTEIGTKVTLGSTMWQYTLGTNDVPGWRNLSALAHGEFKGPAQTYPNSSDPWGPGSKLALDKPPSTDNPPFAVVQDGIRILEDGVYLFEGLLNGTSGPPPAMNLYWIANGNNMIGQLIVPSGGRSWEPSVLCTATISAGTTMLLKTKNRASDWSATCRIRVTKLQAGL